MYREGEQVSEKMNNWERWGRRKRIKKWRENDDDMMGDDHYVYRKSHYSYSNSCRHIEDSSLSSLDWCIWYLIGSGGDGCDGIYLL